MTALLEVARSVSWSSLEQTAPCRTMRGGPAGLEQRLQKIGEEIGRAVAIPYFSAKTWQEIEAEWDKWTLSSRSLFEQLFLAIRDSLEDDQLEFSDLKQSSMSFFKRIAGEIEEPLKTTFMLSIDTINAADRLSLRVREKFLAKVKEDEAFKEEVESFVTKLELAVLLVSLCIGRKKQDDEVTEDQLDFAVLMVKRCAAVYYANIRKIAKE